MPLQAGGLGATKVADETVQGLLDKLSEEIIKKILEKGVGEAANQLTLKPIEYKTQVVAGTNYFVKVQVAEDKFVHARIYRNLQGEASLHSVSEMKAAIDDIGYF